MQNLLVTSIISGHPSLKIVKKDSQQYENDTYEFTDILYKIQYVISWRIIIRWEIGSRSSSVRKVLCVAESAVINVDRRRGTREMEGTPSAHQDDSSSSCGACIRAHLTFARHKFMQNNSTTTVHYGADGAGSKTLSIRAAGTVDRPRRGYPFLVPPVPLRAAALVFWLAISIRLTLRDDPARLTAQRLN